MEALLPQERNKVLSVLWIQVDREKPRTILQRHLGTIPANQDSHVVWLCRICYEA